MRQRFVRFVQVVVKNPDQADELAQDAMVRLLKGDFAGADPGRGRFRDLLKTAIRNMARNYWSKENRRTGVDYDLSLVDGDADDVSSELDREWTNRWRA
ncbi:MAG: sigma factor [Pirellulaceae bacterium]